MRRLYNPFRSRGRICKSNQNSNMFRCLRRKKTEIMGRYRINGPIDFNMGMHNFPLNPAFFGCIDFLEVT